MPAYVNLTGRKRGENIFFDLSSSFPLISAGAPLGSKPTNNQKARELIGTFPIGTFWGTEQGAEGWREDLEGQTGEIMSEGEIWEMRPEK